MIPATMHQSNNKYFLVVEQLYTHPCVCVCVCDVCLYDVPRFVCPLFRTSTKARMTPDSDQLYSGVQTDCMHAPPFAVEDRK